MPSWNNDYYCQMLGALPVMIECDASHRISPDGRVAPAARPRRAAAGVELSAQSNGHGVHAEQLADICDLVLEENARRGPAERPLFVMYDQVYWMITAGGATHVDPISLRPAIAPYVISSTRSPRRSPRPAFVSAGRLRRPTSSGR